MLLRIRHETIYRYGEPAKSAVQKLLLTPRNCNIQRIVNWRIEVDRDCRLTQREDAFGNILHCFTADGPFDTLTTLVEGEVETFDTAGVVSGAVERFPPALYFSFNLVAIIFLFFYVRIFFFLISHYYLSHH